MKADAASLFEFLSVPLGTLILSLLLFLYLFDTGDCGMSATTASNLGDATCEMRIGIEVPSTFDPFLAAGVSASALAFVAGGIASWLRSR